MLDEIVMNWNIWMKSNIRRCDSKWIASSNVIIKNDRPTTELEHTITKSYQSISTKLNRMWHNNSGCIHAWAGRMLPHVSSSHTQTNMVNSGHISWLKATGQSKLSCYILSALALISFPHKSRFASEVEHPRMLAARTQWQHLSGSVEWCTTPIVPWMCVCVCVLFDGVDLHIHNLHYYHMQFDQKKTTANII